jgi:hypothetical protein
MEIETSVLSIETTHNPTTSLHTKWNSKMEVVTRSIGENSQGYKFMHIRAAQTDMKYYEILMYLGIIMGPLSAVISGIGMSLRPEAPTTFPIISSIVGFIAGILTTVVKFSKFDQVASAHKLAASKYTSLESNVRRQLSLPRDVRIDSMTYIQWLNTSYDELFLASPLIPDKIVEQYEKASEETGISIPIRQNVTITVNTDYEDRAISDLTNTQNILVNGKNKPELPIEHDQGPLPTPEEHKTLQGTTSIKRGASFLPLSELNKYSDGMMKYEMKRMMGFG